MVSRKNTRASSRKSKSRVASRKSKSRVPSRKYKSRVASRKSRSRKYSRRVARRRQRGGANESLAQGADFSKFHMQQHGGSRALMGAPLDYTGELDASLRGAARMTGLDASYREASAHGVQAGGARRKSKARKSKSKRKSRKSKSRKQRGGCGGAPVGQPTMLLDNYAKAGLPSFKAI